VQRTLVLSGASGLLHAHFPDIAASRITTRAIVFAQAEALTTLDAKPLVVVTATESLHKITGWSDAQDQLVDLSTNSQHCVIDATRAGLVDDEVTFEPSVHAIVDVVKSIRVDGPVATR
jgi:hypothetical protein